MPYRPHTIPAHPEFAEYVRGKTIALVGPAAPIGDQSAEIEAHDLVGRFGLILAEHPAEYGRRTDIAYFNSAGSRHVMRHPEPWTGVPWLVFKQARGNNLRNGRQAFLPSGPSPNQLTVALYDLSHYAPASVTVYGADLYLSGPKGAYFEAYWDAGDQTIGNRYAGQRAHDQHHQRTVIRQVRERTGWPNGDARFIAALELDDVTYQRRHRSAWNDPAIQNLVQVPA